MLRTVAPNVALDPVPKGQIESNPDNLEDFDDSHQNTKKPSKTHGITGFSDVASSEALLNFFSPPSPSGMAMLCGW